MSLKAELETWAAALKAYDEEDFAKALEQFSKIADSSKILTNMGLIYATLGEHEAAVERFIEATQLDQYLAVAYFQCGVSNFLLTRYELAYKDFDEALLYLRGNQLINYEQLGLNFKLYATEVLFNKGLCQVYLGRRQEGLQLMAAAASEKVTDEHNVIEEAIQDRGEGYTVFSIPVGVLYRPSEKKLKNSVTKDYMGKAKLVASSDPTDSFTSFTGSTRLKQGISPAKAYIEPPEQPFNTTIVPTVARSATFAASERSTLRTDSPPAAALERSKTTINTSTQRPLRSEAASPAIPERTKTSPNLGQKDRGNKSDLNLAPTSSQADGLLRSRSVKNPAFPTSTFVRDTGIGDFYDSYLDNSSRDPSPPLSSVGKSPYSDRQRAPARNPSVRVVQRSQSLSGSTRRRPTKTPVRAPIRTSYEEEEGYASGDFEEVLYELSKIRIKLHYQGDVRGMTLDPQTSFDDFMRKITTKFDKGYNGLGLKFKDEDGGKVSLRDESDYELAIETARESSKGKPEGRLEIWCTDI